MNCRQCYTAQVPECIDKLLIYAEIPGYDSIDTVIKITDSHGNVYYVIAETIDNIIIIDIANSSLPKNLINRYAGTITLEVMNSVSVATMIICEKEYTCITLDVINNSASLIDKYPIGCQL